MEREEKNKNYNPVTPSGSIIESYRYFQFADQQAAGVPLARVLSTLMLVGAVLRVVGVPTDNSRRPRGQGLS